MRAADLEAYMALVAAKLRGRAERGMTDGRINAANEMYLWCCTEDDSLTGARLIFTRDTGHHTSGWFKNPEFERCYHLSLSRVHPKEARLWARSFFREEVRLCWIEPAATREAKRLGVQHWRLFCDEYWQPIHPRGEVYSTDLTERGWRSASQVLEEDGVLVESPLYAG